MYFFIFFNQEKFFNFGYISIILFHLYNVYTILKKTKKPLPLI